MADKPRWWRFQFSLKMAIGISLVAGLLVGGGVWYFKSTRVLVVISNKLERPVSVALISYYTNSGGKQPEVDKAKFVVGANSSESVHLRVEEGRRSYVDYDVYEESKEYFYRAHASVAVNQGTTTQFSIDSEGIFEYSITNRSGNPIRVELWLRDHHLTVVPLADPILPAGATRYFQPPGYAKTLVRIFLKGATEPIVRSVWDSQVYDYVVTEDGTVVP